MPDFWTWLKCRLLHRGCNIEHRVLRLSAEGENPYEVRHQWVCDTCGKVVERKWRRNT